MEIADLVKKETGTPFVNFDGDQTDPRNFSEAQFDLRMQALSEVMDSRKEEDK